jgi:hypothetical protein
MNSRLFATIKSSKFYKCLDDKLDIAQNFWWILGSILGFVVIVIIATNVISYISDRPVAEEYTAEGVYIDPDGKHNVEYIQHRVKQIYSSTKSNNRKAYSSKGFYELYQKVQDVNKDLRSLTGESGLELPAMNSEGGTISIQQVDFISPRCHRLAYAVFETSDTPMGYKLRFERGDWYVDDILHPNLPERNACWHFLASHGQLKYLIGKINLNGVWYDNSGYTLSIKGFKMKDGAKCTISNVKIRDLEALKIKTLKGTITIKDNAPIINVHDGDLFISIEGSGGSDDAVMVSYMLQDGSNIYGTEYFFKR